MLKLKRVDIQGFQIVLRPDRHAVPRLRHRRDRRPERLWKIQSQRRHQLGAGRAKRQEPARRAHGRCDLRRHARTQTAGHGASHPDHGRSGAHTTSLVDPDEWNGNGNGNGNGHAQAARRLTITRRLYRSGESEYLINGHHARLRDIQDLFSGTGLGPESYAIIEQGRIGQILSNKPADRRAIIEEAAGIGKYKTRKRLAEAKLESARAESFARVRHSGRSRPAGEFAEAPGIEGAAL